MEQWRAVEGRRGAMASDGREVELWNGRKHDWMAEVVGECNVKADERSYQSQANSVGEGVMTREVGGDGVERKEVV